MKYAVVCGADVSVDALAPIKQIVSIIFKQNLLVADNAVIGNCIDTVNVKSDPVGNITDLFRRDLGCMDDIVDNVVFLYLTDVSLAIRKELLLYELVLEAWHNDVR